MSIHRLFVFFSLIINLLGYSFAASTDSLYHLLEKTKDYESKIKLHKQLAQEFWTANHDSCNYHLDKAQYYALKEKLTEEAKAISFIRGIFLIETGQFDKALEVFHWLLDQTTDETDPSVMARILGNIGNCYNHKNYVSKAIEYYERAITYFEELDSKQGLATAYSMIANLFYQNSNYREAIQYFFKGIDYFKQAENGQGIAINTMNIGVCYKELNYPDSSIIYYKNALSRFEEIGNMPFYQAQCLANIGNYYYYFAEKKNLLEAEKYLLKAEAIFNQMHNPLSIIQINHDIASLQLEAGKFDGVLKRIDFSLDLSRRNRFDNLILHSYHMKWKYYDKINDCNNAHKWLREYIKLKDSIDLSERKQNIDFILAQFDTERKEKEIELLKQSEIINRLELKRKTQAQYITLIGLLGALAFVAFLYINSSKRKRINQLLSTQNQEINQQKEEIIAQRDEIERHRDVVQEQNVKLEKFRQHTTESLRYAQSIQAAILPSEKVIHCISEEHFVLMKPCEFVSGDFFWATTFNEFQIFCVADCTGHGVPGAFMSILGITALNDIVIKHRISKPSDILGYLRQSVIETLSQNDAEQLHKDGMDIALCTFNSKTRELQFAGAGIPMWVVTNNPECKLLFEAKSEKVEYQNLNLFEVKGDPMPVGLSPRIKPFTNSVYALNNNSVAIYLLTDGYTDQFDETRQAKYGNQKLKKQIIEINHLAFTEQKVHLEKEFDVWKGSGYQLDDVAILGIKI